MATIWPGSVARAAGAVTWASTLPTATRVPTGSPVTAAAASVSRPATSPSWPISPASFSSAKSGEARVERRQEVAVGIATVLVDPLVAGGARVADVAAGQLPHDPVRRLDEAVRAGVELGVLLQQLEPLGELPLAGDQAAVAADPGLPPLVRELVDPIRLGLGGVVLPQLDVGVRPVGVLGQLAQRRPVREHRQHRAGGEVRPEPDHLAGVDPGGAHRLGYGVREHVDVVARHLERPVRGQRHRARGEAGVQHPVRVVVHGAAHLGAVGDPDHDGATGERAEVDADRELVGAGHAGTSLVVAPADRTDWSWMLPITTTDANPSRADRNGADERCVVLSKCYR